MRVKVDTGLHDIWSAIIIHYFRILMFLLLMQIFNYNCVHTLCDNAYPKVDIIRGRQELRIGNINIHALALRLLLIKFMVLISLLLQKKTSVNIVIGSLVLFVVLSFPGEKHM